MTRPKKREWAKKQIQKRPTQLAKQADRYNRVIDLLFDRIIPEHNYCLTDIWYNRYHLRISVEWDEPDDKDVETGYGFDLHQGRIKPFPGAATQLGLPIDGYAIDDLSDDELVDTMLQFLWKDQPFVRIYIPPLSENPNAVKLDPAMTEEEIIRNIERMIRGGL